MLLRRAVIFGSFLCLLVPPMPGQSAASYVTRTIAGIMQMGDGGQATSALLETPQAVAIDANGNMYIADSGNGVIRKVTRAGLISTLPGYNGYAYDIKLDSAGNLYIAAFSRVYKLTQAGTLTTVAGNGNYTYTGDEGPATSAAFNGIFSIALNSSNNLYICDQGNHAIRKVTADGNVHTVAGGNGKGFGGDGHLATSALLNYPDYIAMDAAGNLYIADASNNRIRMVGLDGMIGTLAGSGVCCNTPDGGMATSAYLSPGPMAADSAGNVYFWDFMTSRVRVVSGGILSPFAGSGIEGFAGDGNGAASARFSSVSGIATDSSKNVYIVENNNERVRMISGGIINTVAGKSHFGGDNGPAAVAQLHRPEGVAVAPDGTVYFTDTVNHRIRKIATDGTITTIAGTGDPGFSGDGRPALSATLSYPDRITIDSQGNLFFVDQSEFRVRKIATSGTITTVAGNGLCCTSNDSLGALNSPFFYIGGIAVDGTGNLYVAEQYTNKIKKVTPGGALSTYAGSGVYSYGGDGQSALAAQMKNPTDLAIDGAGNLYINDTYNYRIRKVDTLGAITTFAGNGNCCSTGDGAQATAAAVNANAMVADSSGGLWFVDYLGVRYVARDGTINRVAGGNNTVGYGGDNAPSGVNSLFYYPSGIALAATGDLMIADTQNSRIRKLQPNDVAKLDIVSGTSQSGVTGTALKAMIVKVTGRASFGVPGMKVAFQVTAGSATLSTPSTATDANGMAGIGVTPTKAGTLVVTATAGSLTVTFTATVTDPLVVLPADIPVIASGGIGQNGFSVPPVQIISTGAITTVYGSNFTPAGTANATNIVTGGKLSTNFGAVCVTFDGVAAPIFGLATTQVTVEVPAVTPGTVAVQVVRNCGGANELKSNVVNVTAQASSPEFLYFQINGDGHNPVAAVSPAGDYIGVPGSISGVTLRQAVAGDILVVYALGLGATTPSQTMGLPAAGIAQAAQTVSVSIGGVKLAPSDVLYGGASPAFIGLYQINLRVPAGVTSGNQPIVLQVGSNSSPGGAYLAIR